MEGVKKKGRIRKTKVLRVIPITVWWRCDECGEVQWEERYSLPGKIYGVCQHCGETFEIVR